MTRRIAGQMLLGLLAASSLACILGPNSLGGEPFRLGTEEQAEVDRVLDRWEQLNSQVKTFECRFRRWIYDSVFNPPEPGKDATPKFTEDGIIKYAAPNRLLVKVEKSLKGSDEMPIEESRAESWSFDGKSVFEFRVANRQFVKHDLPPEVQGSAVIDGPLAFGFPAWVVLTMFGGTPSGITPFPLGATAAQIKGSYFIRKVPSTDARKEIRLEAYPRSQAIAKLCEQLMIVFDDRDMSPLYLKVIGPGRKSWASYQFFDLKINRPSSAQEGDPF